MQNVQKSKKLHNVCYDIRGPVLEKTKQLEEDGHYIIKLNIGNPTPFGFYAPDEIIRDVIVNLPEAQGYSDSKGIFTARKAIMQYYQAKGIRSIDVDNIYLGNGISELIVMSMQGLLNNDDEVLIPAPDYPLWTAAVNLAGGKAVHYICDEQSEWYPDLKDIEGKITSKTRGIVIINPNNPTGSVYPEPILQGIIKIACENDLIIYSDEIYDKIVFDEAKHIPIASLTNDTLVVTFSGLSKTYRAAGLRSGWMVLTGKLSEARDYIEGLNILSNMRLCSNVPGQFAIQTSLGGYQSINDLISPGGRLYHQRNLCYDLLKDIPGISCVKPKGAMYFFPRIDTKKFCIQDDEKFVLDLLTDKKLLIVHGTAFNWQEPDHFRVVFLPSADILRESLGRLSCFLGSYSQVNEKIA